MLNWLKNFMMGRYGLDQLSVALLIFSFSLTFIASLLGIPYLGILCYALLGIYLFRVLSRDIARRRQENYRFLKYWYPVKAFFTRYSRRIKDCRQYRYYRCVNCKRELRVPRGKGRIQISCPHCHQQFIKKT